MTPSNQRTRPQRMHPLTVRTVALTLPAEQAECCADYFFSLGIRSTYRAAPGAGAVRVELRTRLSAERLAELLGEWRRSPHGPGP